MRLSKEILESMQQGLVCYNLDEVFTVNDIEHIQNGKPKLSNKETVYLLGISEVSDDMIANSKGIILLQKKTAVKLDFGKINSSRLIICENPRIISEAIDKLLYNEELTHSVNKFADVHPKAKIGQNVHIGAYTVIDECTIGDNTIIHDHCYIGRGVNIGSNSEIHSGARIGLNVFGFKKNADGEWMKHHHIGSVTIGHQVTIGSNACINNGFINNTIIEDEAFIDNLCHVGSSASIGQGTIVAANSFIAQYSTIGKRCWISAGVTIRENIKITDDTFIGIGSTVLKNIKNPGRYFGLPASRIPE